MQEKFKIYVIHHSHTDVGYTDTQEKMKNHHVGFIREVIEILNNGSQPNFKWNCESYWGVEQFLREATEEEKKDFVKWVTAGNICISASYLNLTEIVSSRVLDETMQRCQAEMKSLGIYGNYAMTADINGYSWGFADILIKHNVKGLMSNIHTHHGYSPLFKKQMPFYWQATDGKKILVWNGEHYLLGNELGLAQSSEFEYSIQDGLSWAHVSPFEKAKMRIEAYVNNLHQDESYPYHYVSVNVSGNMTDNGPPSLKILDFIQKFNESNESIEIVMSTLDEFFSVVEHETDIPTYQGDWTDWWADGVGSTPADLMFYRSANRKYNIVRKLDQDYKIADKQTVENALYNLMFYSEHTWGYSSSITEPYHPQVNNLDQWKRLYALKANENATIALEKIAKYHGETQISLQKKLSFKAVNPHDKEVKDMLVLDLEQFYGFQHFKIIDAKTKEDVQFQISSYSRGPEICINVHLQPKESKEYLLVEVDAPALNVASRSPEGGIEGVKDLYHVYCSDVKNGGGANTDGIENDWVKISYEIGKGITSIYDKGKKAELINKNRKYLPFLPIYEKTELDGLDYLYVRRTMGRNRKMPRTKRSVGVLVDVRVLENGKLYSSVELKYEIKGCQNCSVILTVMKTNKRIYADFRLHKDSVWEPENLYLTLPFTSGEKDETLFIDKTNAILRPRVDQLPGSCTDFYSMQNGLAFIGKKSSLIVTTQDAPLLAMGRIDHHPIVLSGEGAENLDDTYSWVMNNFWETNFKVSLGGFYQFRYAIEVYDSTDVKEVFAEAEAINEGTLNFYMFK